MRVAVVGTGIAGLVAADALHREHDLTVFEAADWIGGHTHTVEIGPGRLPIDTGFIVFNERTYPNFCALLRRLGVAWKPSTMSFSVRDERDGLEYNGTSLDTLFAQRSNVLRPRFWRMIRDILRFYREARAVLEADEDVTLGEYLNHNGYSRAFVEQHLVPMGAAVWSARPDRMLGFPMRFLVRFFDNHGFLQVDDRPQWQVVQGGSRTYVEALVAPFRDRIRTSCPVERVERDRSGVHVHLVRGGQETFDRVVLATHADLSLHLLANPTPAERDVLGAFAYQRNEVLLHTDARLMPRRRRAWASWNYHVTDPPSALPTVTYWMNELQGLDEPEPYLVTLNRTRDIDPARVLGRHVYHHPIYSLAAVAAQARHTEIDGTGGVHYCGAYWGYGFHEDGVKSGLEAARRLTDAAVPEGVA